MGQGLGLGLQGAYGAVGAVDELQQILRERAFAKEQERQRLRQQVLDAYAQEQHARERTVFNEGLQDHARTVQAGDEKRAHEAADRGAALALESDPSIPDYLRRYMQTRRLDVGTGLTVHDFEGPQHYDLHVKPEIARAVDQAKQIHEATRQYDLANPLPSRPSTRPAGGGAASRGPTAATKLEATRAAWRDAAAQYQALRKDGLDVRPDGSRLTQDELFGEFKQRYYDALGVAMTPEDAGPPGTGGTGVPPAPRPGLIRVTPITPAGGSPATGRATIPALRPVIDDAALMRAMRDKIAAARKAAGDPRPVDPAEVGALLNRPGNREALRRELQGAAR